jgi:hypothetical protein
MPCSPRQGSGGSAIMPGGGCGPSGKLAPGGTRTCCKAMVEAGQGAARDPEGRFIVADDTDIHSGEMKRPYGLWAKGRTYWLPAPTVYVRAVHPDYPHIRPPLPFIREQQLAEGDNDGQSAASNPMVGFTSEVTMAFPKVFDFMHCTLLHSASRVSGWEAAYRQTKVPTRFSACTYLRPLRHVSRFQKSIRVEIVRSREYSRLDSLDNTSVPSRTCYQVADVKSSKLVAIAYPRSEPSSYYLR